MTETTAVRDENRSKIVDAAARLLHSHGPGAVTTRRVAEDAGVQAPTIYRLFGDKDGLLDAVAEHVMASYASAKADRVDATAGDTDPVAQLRASWAEQVAFALSNPALFRLVSDPDRVVRSPAARIGRQSLESRIHRIAASGRLRVGERQAADLVYAGVIGAVQATLSTPPGQRDPDLAPAMLDTVLARILTDGPAHATRGPVDAAVALRAAAPRLDALSGSEQALLAEWLDRVIAAG